MDDFKALAKKTHDLGMYLIIDWVPNHSSWDNPLVKDHPDWYAKDSLGKMYSPWDWTDVMTVLTYTIPGMPLVYSAQEAGSTKRLKFFEKDPIDWSNMKFSALYKRLDQLKHNNPALWNPGFGGNYERLTTGNDKQVLAFKRKNGTNSVIVVLNMSAEPVSVQLSDATIKGKYTEWFTGNRMKPALAAISLAPWAYVVYTKK